MGNIQFWNQKIGFSYIIDEQEMFTRVSKNVRNLFYKPFKISHLQLFFKKVSNCWLPQGSYFIYLCKHS